LLLLVKRGARGEEGRSEEAEVVGFMLSPPRPLLDTLEMLLPYPNESAPPLPSPRMLAELLSDRDMGAAAARGTGEGECFLPR
jgi:hypothetical protein